MDIAYTAGLAAMWWTDKIFGEQVDQKITTRDGRDPASESHEVVLNLLAAVSRPAFTKRERDRFEKCLVNSIRIELENKGRANLSVDYHPCNVLYSAVDISAVVIPPLCWPLKTNMWIEADGSIYVKNGYGARNEKL